MKLYLLFVLLCFPFISFGQKQQYPKNYFSSPLKIPIVLSGTFGELRNNHFHSGLDIKTQQKEGLKIYAPANGYVSRIKIAQWGYGKALYITHPNGYTTVYAHLSRYSNAIEQYVKKIQYKKERYIIGNIYPKATLFSIKKGELIAYTGNTGGSMGPHLHYEIRKTKTEHIINPMCFGIDISDNKPPVFQTLMAYPLSDNALINNSTKKTLIAITKKGKNTYLANTVFASGTIGFGVNTFDRLDDANNKNDVYSLEMKVNGVLVFYYNVKTFSFSESKYINLLIDYPYYANYKNRIQKTYKVKGNKLSIYKNLINNGKLIIKNGMSYNVKIIAKDFKGNTSTITIPVRGVKKSTILFKQKDTTSYKIIAQNFTKFKLKNVTVSFPKNTFYNDCYLDFKVEKGVAHINKPTIPLDRRFTLTFDVSKYSEKEKQHLYIANINNKRYPKYQKTIKKKVTFYTTTKTLGDYTLKTDNQKPKIKILNIKKNQWISKINTLKVKITDTLSGIKSYRATIDNQWILMEYDPKKKMLTYNFNDKKLVGSKHILKISVSDKVGNTKSLSITFYKK